MSNRVISRSMAAGRVAITPTKRFQPKRNMGGHTDVKKNAFVEEWNGRREITEYSFEYDRFTTPWIAATFGFFGFCFWICKAELMRDPVSPNFSSGNTCINGKPRYMALVSDLGNAGAPKS